MKVSTSELSDIDCEFEIRSENGTADSPKEMLESEGLEWGDDDDGSEEQEKQPCQGLPITPLLTS